MSGRALRAVAVLQGLLVAATLAGGERLLGEPIRNGDYAAHFYAALHVRDHWERAGALWGYDPFWMAGYPEGVVSLIDAKLFCLAVAAAPAGLEAAFFNGAIVLSLLLVPGLVAWASWTVDEDEGAAAGAALAAVAAIFTVPVAVFFWAGGALCFVLASALIVPALVLLAQALEDGGLLSRRGVGGLVAAAAATAVHPEVVPLLAAGLVPSLWRPARGWGRVGLGFVVIGIVCGLSMLPLIDAVGALEGQIRPVVARGFLEGSAADLVDDVWRHLFSTAPGWAGGAGGLLAIALLAGFGRGRVVHRPGAAGRALAAAAVGALLLAYGGLIAGQLVVLQPRRFQVSLAFLLAVPAGAGLTRLWRERGSRRMVFTLTAAVVAAILIEAGMALWPAVALGPAVDETEAPVAAVLRSILGGEERALVESSWLPVAAAPGDGRKIQIKRFALLPLSVAAEFLGNPGPGAVTAQRYLTFGYGRIAGRELSTIPPAELAEWLGRYGVGVVVACRPETQRALARFPAVFERGIGIGDCRIQRVRGARASLVLEGRGRVRAERDRIEVRDAGGERIVLKYHWLPTLRTEPSLPIEEAPQPGAPVGFIAVRPQAYDRFVIVQRPGGVAESFRGLGRRLGLVSPR